MVALARRAYARMAGDLRNGHGDAVDDVAPGRGLAVAALFSLPLWAFVVTLVVVFRAA